MMQQKNKQYDWQGMLLELHYGIHGIIYLRFDGLLEDGFSS